MPGEDRLTALLEQEELARVTGIDFIQVVDPTVQTLLRVFFLINPDELDDPIVNTADLPVDVSTDTVTIESISGGERLAEVPVVRATYKQVPLNGETRTVLEIGTAEPGDFSIYRLTVIDEPERRIDRFFNGVEFSFKQGCPSLLDCKRGPHDCPPEEFVDFPVDYLARDFVSIRNALLDFASQRYPAWTEKIVADADVMVAEVMAALGDELSYIQDRYAREAYLETATQRRSLRHHSRLVDYDIHDGRAAGTFLHLTVNAGGRFLDAGSRVWAPGQGEPPIPFELGAGLSRATADEGAPVKFWVHEAWNEIEVHIPDNDKPCLPAASTELFLLKTFPTDLQVPPGEVPPGSEEKFWVGKWLLLLTNPADPSIPARRHLVRVREVEHMVDPLCLDDSQPPQPIDITRIKWEDEQALPFEMCLRDMVVGGNLVFATAGETINEFFSIRTNSKISPQDAHRVGRAIERQGPLDEVACRRSVTFLYSLKQTEAHGLGWLGNLREGSPEVELQEVNAVDLQPIEVWKWQSTLLNSRGFQDHFTMDHGTWRRIIGFRRIGEVIEHVDYASGAGFTIRFGDGEFGRIPEDGTVFQVRYRTGPGTRGNLPADTIVNLKNPADETQADLAGVLTAVTNPLPVSSAVDPEEVLAIKQLAPEAFRAETFRAVRPEDYAEIAERLPGVQRAGARFRWTGSWLSSFVTPDPLGAFDVSLELRTELENLMDCVRQAGREVVVRNPRFVNIDLEITICVEPSAYAGQVKTRVLEALLGRKGVRPTNGFFHPDNFTFGTPLRRAALEAAIQGVAGVLAVERMCIRARGITGWRELRELVFTVGDNQIIRLQNDPRFPERGSLRILTQEEELSCKVEDIL